MYTDPVSDMLTRIRNGAQALRPEVQVPHSRLKENIAGILKKEGYISEYKVEGTPRPLLTLKLKYNGKKCIIEGLKRTSRPGLRHYVGSTDIPRVRGGLGVAILSTSQGVMTGAQARRSKLGGEVLCYVW